MALRHALLALLEAKPMTGYELAGQFDASAAYVWHAHHPQIYTELRRMEADGLVEAEEAPRGAGATKRRYFLTDKGCDELLRWLTEESEPPRERDAAYLKATYFEFGSFDTVRRHLRGHREHYAKQAAHWSAHANQLERRDTALLRQRLAHAPQHAHAAIVAYKVRVADRVGRKPVLVGAIACFAVFTLATTTAGSVPVLLVYRFLTGLGLGAAVPCAISLASELVPARRRGTVAGLLFAGFPVGGVLAGLLGSRMAPTTGWRSLFLVGTVGPLVVAAVIALVLPDADLAELPDLGNAFHETTAWRHELARLGQSTKMVA